MTTLRWLFVSGVLAAGWLVPAPAEACGGLFCSGSNPIAVEQNAERVLFTQNDDGTFSAYVEIQYSGDPTAFSWVVPVPETPVLDVVPPSTLQILDLLTRPSIIAPPTQCSSPANRSGSLGCADSLAGMRAAEDGVRVEDLERVGPFEPKVVSAEDPQLIFDWLNENGYLLTAEMRPFIERYATEGMKFLALRLAPGAQTSDIAPIKMTYATPCPVVPLALTAVSAEPEMSVMVFFLGPTRMRSVNYQNLEINPDEVRMDALRQSNYYALVSHRIDEAGGRAFVTELAGPTSQLNDPNTIFINAADQMAATEHVQSLLAEHSYVTRLYARLSAWEMTVDPDFEASDGGDVSNVFDLSGRPPVETCGDTQGVACGSVYCGPGSECGLTEDGLEGCVCKEGTVARGVTAPDLQRGSVPSVTCQNRSFNVLFSANLIGPCAQYSCGSGQCVITNGFPTCQCAKGQLARVDPSRPGTGLLCEDAVETFGPERLVWNEETQACGVGAGALWTVFGLVALRRRRMRP